MQSRHPTSGPNLPRNFSWPPVFQLTGPSGSIHRLTPPELALTDSSSDDEPFFHDLSPLNEEAETITDSFPWDAPPRTQQHPVRPPLRKPIERGWSGYFLDRELAAQQQRAASFTSDTASFSSSRLDAADDEDEEEAFIWPGTPQSHLLARSLHPDPYHQRPRSLTESEPRLISPRRRRYPRTMSGHHHHRQSWHEPDPRPYPVADLSESQPRPRSAVPENLRIRQLRSQSTPNLPLQLPGLLTPLFRPQAVVRTASPMQKMGSMRGCGALSSLVRVLVRAVRGLVSWFAGRIMGCLGGQ